MRPDKRSPGPLEVLLPVEDGPEIIERSSPDIELDHAGRAWPAVLCASGPGRPEWLCGEDCRVFARPGTGSPRGETFARFRGSAGELLACTDSGGRVHLPFSLIEAYESYVLERWTAGQPSPMLGPSHLDAYYRLKRLVPRRLQLAGRRALIARLGEPVFPRWPHDDSVERLARFYGTCVLRALGRERVRFRWFWPDGRHAAVILTHDIEGPSGMRNALRVAEIEEQHGFRSCFNVVADWYPVDWGVVGELRARGHEIGSHGLYHNRSLFSSRQAFEHQLPMLREAAARLGAVGFRSPATHRVVDWLNELPVDYDTTMPSSDPYEAQPGGACTSWPFFVGSLVELPYTLPQDHTLFTLMGRRHATPWIEQMRRVKRSFGIVQCVSHPDDGYLGDPRNEAIYRDFLDAVSEEPDLWHALPREVAAWWRARAAGQELPGLRTAHGTIEHAEIGTLAELRPPSDDAAHHAG